MRCLLVVAALAGLVAAQPDKITSLPGWYVSHLAKPWSMSVTEVKLSVVVFLWLGRTIPSTCSAATSLLIRQLAATCSIGLYKHRQMHQLRRLCCG